MQKLIKAFENMMVAITFAEAGEYDEARKIAVPEPEPGSATDAVVAVKAPGKA